MKNSLLNRKHCIDGALQYTENACTLRAAFYMYTYIQEQTGKRGKFIIEFEIVASAMKALRFYNSSTFGTGEIQFPSTTSPESGMQR